LTLTFTDLHIITVASQKMLVFGEL